MSSWLIILVGIVYGATAIEQFISGNTQLAIIFSGYTISNIGLYYLT